MPDLGVSEAIEAGLVSAAASTAASFAISALTKPTAAASPVRYPPNDITRGGYLPVVYGRRIVGCHVAWLGDRASFAGPSSGGTSLGGGGGKSQSQYLEGGWHQLCHGPVRRLYRIWQSGQVLFHTLLDNTTTADGSTFQAGVANNPGKTGDNFAWYSGRDPLDTPGGSAPYQPVSPYLQNKAGLVSAYPGLAYVLWHRKLLGGSPSWMLMKYEIETFPADILAACGLADIFTPNGIPLYFPETTPASSDTRSVTVWLNGQQSIPAGSYTITYDQGAFRLNAQDGWQVYAPDVPNFFIQVVDAAGDAITTTPYVDHGGLRPPNQFDSQAAAEAANAGASKTFTWAGGPMGFRFGDITDHPGASNGTPNPTFTVQLTAGGPSYTASIAVQGGAAGSGDSGWNPAVALYVLLCAPFPYGCGISPYVIDQTAFLAVATTLAAERLACNVLIENGQQADDAIGGLMIDCGLLLNQVGGFITPYLVRTETTVMSVPDDLVADQQPEQQRQVSNFGGDRFTFQIDDVLNDFATSDVTFDNDAQAFANNRPQAQTIKLPTITSRSVARRVGVRQAVERIGNTHKVPAIRLLREARNPAFHPGRCFVMGGVQYRISAWKPDTVGISAEIDAYLDQYGDVSITYDADNDDANQSVPPSAPPEPDLFFNPVIIPRSEWPSASTPAFAVPRVRANDAVNGATVWISTASTGTYTQLGNQDAAQAGGTLVTAFDGSAGVLATGPELSPYNDDVTDVPDLTGDDADYNAGELTLLVEAEIMLLRSITANPDGSYTLNDVTRGAFGTTVAAHSIGTPAIIISREDIAPQTSSLLLGAQGGTLWIKTQPTDGQTVVDLALVTPEPLAVPLNLLATITVTAPAGGSYYIGLPLAITWQTADLTGTLTLSYSTDGGVTYTTIAAGVTDTGTYSWATTGLSAAASVLVKVASTTTPTVYGTSYTFALVVAIAPSAPAGITATAGNTVIFLNWSASAGAQFYRLYRTVAGGSSSLLATISAPAGETIPLSYTDAGLANGTVYCYTVTAVANGAESSPAGPSCATPAAPTGGTPTLAAPSDVGATPLNAGAVVTWSSVSGATGYVVKRSLTTGGPYTVVGSPTTTSFTDTGLTNGTTYYYVVEATGSSGAYSDDSSEASVVPFAAAIDNGSFETPDVNSGPGFSPAPSGSGWTWSDRGGGDGAGIAYVEGGYSFPEPAPDGSQVAYFADDGSYCSKVLGTLTVGDSYDLSYYACARSGYSGGTLSVTLDGTEVDSVTPGSTWAKRTVTFTAASTAPTLAFSKTGGSPFGIDLVSLTPTP